MRDDADRALCLGAAWAVFVLCCILPIGWMLAQSAGRALPAALVGALTLERQRILLGQTLVVGMGAAAGACCIGVPLGVGLARCDPRRVQLARLTFILPLVLPSYVIALAWISLTEPRLAEWTYGLPAAILTLAFSLYPVVMLATEAAVRRVPAHVEEAGRLVAPGSRVWLKIVVPLITPVLLASALAVFVLAISDFAVPSMLRARVYTTEVFTAFSALYDFQLATLTALPLACIGAAASVAALSISRQSLVARTERGPGGLRWSRYAQTRAAALLMIAAVIVVAIPIGIIALTANRGWWVFADRASAEAIVNGAVWSAAAASIVVPVGTLLGHWRTRTRVRHAYLSEVMWVALFALPATVAGIGIIGLWNRAGILGDLYRTDAIVVIAYVSRFMPMAALLCAAVLRRLPVAAEEAATLSGASWARSLSHVVFPLSRRGLIAVWLVMFILMLGDVSLAILVAPPGESNLAVRAYTLMANSPVGDVAAIALVQTMLSVLPLVLIVMLMRDRGAA